MDNLMEKQTNENTATCRFRIGDKVRLSEKGHTLYKDRQWYKDFLNGQANKEQFTIASIRIYAWGTVYTLEGDTVGYLFCPDWLEPREEEDV